MILDADIATEIVSRGDFDALDKFQIVSAEAARIIAGSDEWLLSLNGLTSLDENCAAALGRHHGALALNGLTELSDNAAFGLAKCAGSLQLDGLRHLPTSAATALATHAQNSLLLNSLETLSCSAAEALCQHAGPLELNGLEEISDGAAEALSSRTAPWSARGIRFLSDHAAHLLSHSGGLRSLGDYRVPADSPGYLALALQLAVDGSVDLRGLRSLSPAAAESLPVDADWIFRLGGLESLSAQTAKVLARSGAPIHLQGLRVLTEDTARELASSEGPFIYLNGLTALSDLAVAELERFSGIVSLDHRNVEYLTAGLARLCFREPQFPWSQGYYDFQSLQSISDDAWMEFPPERISQSHSMINLPKLQVLSPKTAEVLVRITDALDLSGITYLNDDTAVELSRSAAWLSLTGLRSISEASVRAFTRKPGGCLEFGCPDFVSATAAHLLCQCTCKVCIHDMSGLPNTVQQILQALPV